MTKALIEHTLNEIYFTSSNNYNSYNFKTPNVAQSNKVIKNVNQRSYKNQ